MNYSIIVPFYNEQDNIFQLNKEINDFINQHFIENERQFEIIYVDDGSEDNTFNELRKTINNKYKTKIFRHSKNYSQSAAIITGIKNSIYDNLIFLDGDCQNDPKDIIKMIEIYEKGYDLINGWRKNRNDNLFLQTAPSVIGNFFVKFFTDSKINDHGCALKIIKKNLIKPKILWGDFHRLLAARITSKNFKVEEIIINHRPRVNGKTKYNLSRILRVIIDVLLINFSKKKSHLKIYFFGKFGLLSIFCSIITLLLIIYNTIYNSIYLSNIYSLILFLFLILIGLLFFLIVFNIQYINRISSDLNNDENKIIEQDDNSFWLKQDKLK